MTSPNTEETTQKLFLGAHTSITGGIYKAVTRTFEEEGGNCLALFTGSQKTWSPKTTFTKSDIEKFENECKKFGLDRQKHIVPHGSYLINLGSPDDEKLEKSRNLFHLEVDRCEQLGIGLYNFHPGSHLNKLSEKKCCKRVAESINLELKKSKNVVMVIENTAGQGSNVGYKFTHLKWIIDDVDDKSRVGVCLDTCHMFAAGYDIRTKETFTKTFDDFERIVGFKYLKAIHLNDSKGILGCRKDRHENIGKGCIGINGFRLLVNDTRFREIPIVLETPGTCEIHKKEITVLRSLVGKTEEEEVELNYGNEEKEDTNSQDEDACDSCDEKPAKKKKKKQSQKKPATPKKKTKLVIKKRKRSEDSDEDAEEKPAKVQASTTRVLRSQSKK